MVHNRAEHAPAGSPRVSIIVNAFNGEAYLAETLASARSQSFADWELILWDDQSRDGTASLGAAAAAADARIRYFLAPAWAPLGAARREAITRARGEWLAFLDQDDLWSPDKLARQMALAEEGAGASNDRPLGLIYGRTTDFWPDGRERDHDHHYAHRPLPEGALFTCLVEQANFIAMSSALVSRAAYDAVGGIPGDVLTCVDYALFLAVSREHAARALQQVCCRYRRHAENLSNADRTHAFEETYSILEGWAGSIDPALLARRRRVYQTLIGWEQIVTRKQFGAGLRRILAEGSLAYLLSRPVVRGLRWLRQTAPGGTSA